MKRQAVIFFAGALSVLLATPAWAQYADQYYHRVGDTIEWKPNNGYYSWWEFKPFYEDNVYFEVDKHAFLPRVSDSARLLQYFYTPVPLKVIGVAGAALQKKSQQNILDTSTIPEYYLIYDADSTEFTLKSKTKWSPFDPHRTVHVKSGEYPYSFDIIQPYDSCCTPCFRDVYFPIYEYYFDEPFYVTDSFYVGCTNANSADHPGIYRIVVVAPTITMYGSIDCGSELIGYIPVVEFPAFSICYPPGILQKGIGQYSLIPYSEENPRWWWTTELELPVGAGGGPAPLLVYPIVEVDTTVPPPDMCDSLRNVQVFPSGTMAMVTWDDFPNYSSVRLKYGYGTNQDTWHSVDVTGSTHYTLFNLESGKRYGLTMQAECEISKKSTPWTEPIYFYTGSDTTGGSEGVQGPLSPLSRLTFLQPNPARDRATVSSYYNLRHIDIHNAAGVMVYSASVAGHEAELPLDLLPPGSYVVTVYTHDGTTHKRLVVAP